MITFIGLICITYLLINAEPLEWVKKFLLISEETKATNEWHMAIITLFNCPLCFGFWVGLIHYKDIYYAAMISLASEIFACAMVKFCNTLK